jgi:hypothetical protein
MTIQVVFSNKPSAINKKLIKFFNLNLLNLNKATLVFDFEVAHPKNIKKYVNKGITNYPVMINPNGSKTVGVEKIISKLKGSVQQYNKKVNNKTDKERLDDYWKQTLGDITIDESGKPKCDDEDGSDDISEDISKKVQAAFSQRNIESGVGKEPTKKQPRPPISTSRNNNLIDKTPAETIKSMGTGDMDDILMAKFFENQEETI